MNNNDVRAAWEYHDATKHSPESVRSTRHYLDWANQPLPYKIYTKLEGLPLPRELVASSVPALAAISAVVGAQHAAPLPVPSRVPDLSTLTTVLQFSVGITKHLRHPGGLMPFRAASCTGALYHIEVYPVSGALFDLEPGVYHFGVHDLALRNLRSGDYRGALVAATSGEPAIAEAPVILAFTSTYWRNSWKYQARTYRHCFWDTGTILANLLAMASAHQLPARVAAGFVDEEVNRLLDVDGQREAAIALVALGYDPATPPGPAPPIGALDLETVPLSGREVDYPAIRAMHAASSLGTADEVAAWRAPGPPAPGGSQPRPSGELLPLPPFPSAAHDPIELVIRRRGSSRRFQRTPISLEDLSAVLTHATRGIPADFLGPPDSSLNDLYLIVNAVEGLPSGTYAFHRQPAALEPLRAGSFRAEAGHLALDQSLAADTAVNIYFLADLSHALERLGNRGYRAAQLEASTTAGKVYLAAYALGLGASGLTFYDDEVTGFFSPHAQGKSVMFLMAVGRPFSQRG